MNHIEVENNTEFVLADFYAEWCSPCQTMDPVIKELGRRRSNSVKVVRIDVDKIPQIARAFKIMSLPTFILLKQDKELWRRSGLITCREFEEIIEKFSTG